MRGVGTRVDITTNKKPRILDLSRLISRAGKVPTGIDRVEMAYFQRFLSDPEDCFFLVRTAFGYCLLDRAGGEVIRTAQVSGQWGTPDLLSRTRSHLSRSVQAAQTLVRRHRIARCVYGRLSRMLSETLPSGAAFYSVGHQNLNSDFLNAVQIGGMTEINVMLHDVIPVLYPETQNYWMIQRFSEGLKAVAQIADTVICLANATRDTIIPELERRGRVPRMVCAPLGVPVPEPRYADLPEWIDLERDYFVIAGTIEPRKNHAMLMETWGVFPPDDRPNLLICGARGWLNQAVFAALDRGQPSVIEVPGLSDSALAAVMHGSKGVLVPSLAEGFGLVPLEAAALGVPVLCSDLPVFRELLGEYARYLDPQDNYSWREAVKDLMASERENDARPFVPPTWEQHFAKVFGKGA